MDYLIYVHHVPEVLWRWRVKTSGNKVIFLMFILVYPYFYPNIPDFYESFGFKSVLPVVGSCRSYCPILFFSLPVLRFEKPVKNEN